MFPSINHLNIIYRAGCETVHVGAVVVRKWFVVYCPFNISASLFQTVGYIIYYSTDVNAEVHDWVIEPVVGNRLTHQIQELTLDTTYYFKIQARNSKGMGPMSEAVHFRTPKSKFWKTSGPVKQQSP